MPSKLVDHQCDDKNLTVQICPIWSGLDEAYLVIWSTAALEAQYDTQEPKDCLPFTELTLTMDGLVALPAARMCGMEWTIVSNTLWVLAYPFRGGLSSITCAKSIR